MTTIEPLLPDHFELVAGWLSRPEVNKWLTGEWRNRQTTPTLLAIAVRNKKNSLFLIRHENQPCGVVALGDIDPIDHIAMIWYFLGDDRFSRKGIVSEAVRQLVVRSFTDIGMNSLHAWIMEDNEASRRVLEKSGFRELGFLRNAAASNGKIVNRIYFDSVPASACQ